MTHTRKTKHCNKCNTTKTRAFFAVRNYAKDGLQTNCKICNAELNKIYAAAKRARRKNRKTPDPATLTTRNRRILLRAVSV